MKELLVKYKVINDVFNYNGLEADIRNKCIYFETFIDKLYQGYSSTYKLKDCFFYISNDILCNAFARKIKGYNIIGVTIGYVTNMHELFNEKYFSNIISVALGNNQIISNSYFNLLRVEDFKINEFMLDCSIHFTFSHEFRHVLQFNSLKVKKEFSFNENCNSSDFSMQKHAWESDADWSAIFEVLKHVFQVKRDLKIKNNNVFKCLLYFGISSVILTKLLFYFRVANFVTKSQVNKVEFYTNKKSHPHPLVRIINILNCASDNVKSVFPEVNIEKQELLNNSLFIVNIYFNNLMPNQNLIEMLFKDLDFLDEINRYNDEIYDYAIKDESIINLLKVSGTKM